MDDDDKLSRTDMQRLERAARQRWGIPDAVREAAITRLAMIIADPKQRPRMHASAIRCLAELDKINVAKEMHDERIETERELREQLPAVIRFEGDPDAGLPLIHPAAIEFKTAKRPPLISSASPPEDPDSAEVESDGDDDDDA